MEQDEEPPAFDSPEGFALRVKYRKHILCIPVDPRTTYDELADTCLILLDKSTSLDGPPSQTQAESYAELTANDVAFYTASHATATNASGTNSAMSEDVHFVIVDRKAKGTIGAMGLKDGPDAVLYIGFKVKGKDIYAKPNVSIPSMNQEEAEDVQMTSVQDTKGKGRR